MAKWAVCMHFVGIATAAAISSQVTGIFQLADYTLDGTFCDAHALGDVAEPDLGVCGETQQNVRMVGKEGPTRCEFLAPGRSRHLDSRNIVRESFFSNIREVVMSGGYGAEQPHRSPIKELREFLGQNRSAFWTVVIYSAFVGLLALATPIAVQALVNTAAFGTVLQPVLVLVVLLFAGLATASVLKALKTWVVEVLQRRAFVETVARLAYRLPRADFTRAAVSDGTHLVHRFFALFTVQKTAASLLLGGVDVVLAASVGMLVLAFYHPVLLAFDIALIACVAMNIGVLGRGGIATSIAESAQKYELAGFLSDLARPGYSFRDRGGSDYAREHIDELAASWLTARAVHFRVVMRQLIGALATQTLASAGLLGLGGWLVIERELTLGQLVAAELIVTAVVSTFSDLGKHLESYYDLVTSVHKLNTLVEVPLESDEQAGQNDQVAEGAAELIIDGLHVTIAGRALFAGARARIAPGERVRLLGPPESGKTLLLETLFGMYRADHGRIALDGVDIRELSKPALRDRVALVRGAEIVRGTVFDNVRLGRRDIGSGRVRALLDALGMTEELARLPQGLDTMLGPEGAKLSDSQAFRLTLARAVARSPGLLAVDADLTSMTPEALERVFRVISEPSAPWTLLIVGHSAQAASQCGRTLYLRNGQLTESNGNDV